MKSIVSGVLRRKSATVHWDRRAMSRNGRFNADLSGHDTGLRQRAVGDHGPWKRRSPGTDLSVVVYS